MDAHLPNLKNTDDLFADTENTWDYPDDELFFIDTQFVGDEKVEYEIIFGNEKVVFIKTGTGGSVRGNQNKYTSMAERIHKRIGATVICASNPDVPHEDIDEAEIRWVVSEIEATNIEFYFIGASDGAYYNLTFAKRFPETVKLIGINTSYMDIIGLAKKLKALPNVFKVLIYGTKDDDFDEVVPALSKMTCDNFAMEFVEGADHGFTDMLDEFVALADYI